MTSLRTVVITGIALAAAILIIQAMIRRRDKREFERQRQFLLDLEGQRLLPDFTGKAVDVTICGPISEATREALEQVAVTVATRVRCQVCGRPLIKHASQARGFGPVCAAKVKTMELTARDT